MSPRGFLKIFACAAALLLAGCAMTWLEDNGTHLAYAIERGAKELKASDQEELVVSYEPLGDAHEPYVVEIEHSKREVTVNGWGNTNGPGGSYITVSGAHQGGTNYHERFVFVPRNLRVAKRGTPTEVVLRKAGPRIDVVELR